MGERCIIVTGAAGFLGSALTVGLSKDWPIVAIDRREPDAALLEAAPRVEWHRVDVSQEKAMASVFDSARQRHGPIDFVIHLAAFYHFDLDWHPEYDRTNVGGTANVLQLAARAGVSRLIFASSLMALAPPPPGKLLDERSPTADVIPYGRSKAISEKAIAQASDRLSSIVLRIGGVFSDWCELPPLSSLIKLWGPRTPVNRIVVGRGDSAIPYLHRVDFVRLVRACIARHQSLGRHEVLLACQHGAASHNDVFLALRRGRSGATGVKEPIRVPAAAARAGLYMKSALGRITGRMPYERPWMLDYVDRPWAADTTTTRSRLGWGCSQEMQICERLPVLLDRFRQHRRRWERRNRNRATGLYTYAPD